MTTDHPVPLAAAPWILKAESWVFPFWNSSTHIKANAPSGLPPGSYHPKESIAGAEAGTFQGGPGGWMLYRYSDSPVGPYDELILVAGIFSTPGVGKGLRITNIYVSSDDSIYNGRRNWNIPKHKARFEWSHPVHTSSSEIQTVSIYLADDSKLDPFFSSKLQPSAYCPNLPLNTTYSFLPPLYLYQPPLIPSKYKEGSREAKVACSTERFLGVAPTFTGSFHLAYISPVSGQKECGDGLHFPKVPPGSWGAGIHLPNVIVRFPEPIELHQKQK